ncbi:hypothetical protein CsatB_011812 [Cannabis sativa]
MKRSGLRKTGQTNSTASLNSSAANLFRSVYSYSLALVTAINNGDMYFNKLGALFEDVIALLSKFPGAVLSHVARSENLAAHGLAKHALRLDDELSWFEEVPAPVADEGVVNS